MYRVTRLATEQSGGDSQDAWRSWVSTFQGRFDFTFYDDEYVGTIVQQSSPAYKLAQWTGAPETLARTALDISRDRQEDYRLVAPLAGSIRIVQDGDVARVGPGELALIHMDVPVTLAHEGVTSLALTIPGDRLARRFGPRPPAHRMLADVGLPRVVRDLLLSVAEQRDALTGPGFDSACDRVVDLLSLAVAGHPNLDETSTDAVVRSAITAYVREHAVDPDITVASMSAAIGWSVRQVQAVLFRAGTTASELIRSERLELARLMLTNPAFASHDVSRIAGSVGFGSASAFSTAYRRHFGVTPSDTRRSATAHSS